MYSELFNGQFSLFERGLNCPGIVGHVKADLALRQTSISALYTEVKSPNGSAVSEIHNFVVAPIEPADDLDEFARGLTSFRAGEYDFRPAELFAETLQVPQLTFVEYAGSVRVREQKRYGVLIYRDPRYRMLRITAFHDPRLVERVKGEDLDRELFEIKFYGIIPLEVLNSLLLERNTL